MLNYLVDLYDNNKLPNLLLYGNNLLGKKNIIRAFIITYLQNL